MQRRAYLSMVAGAAAGGSLLTATTVRGAADEQTHRRGQRDVDLTARDIEDGDDIAYIPPAEDPTAGVSAPVEEDPDASGAVVRFAAARSGEEVVYYMTREWEQFAEMQCRYAAASRAAEYVETELAVDRSVSGGSSSRVADDQSHAVVSVQQTDGQLTVEDVAAVTPATVTTTYDLNGQRYTTEIPIYATLLPEARTMEATDDIAENASDAIEPQGSDGPTGSEDSATGAGDEGDVTAGDAGTDAEEASASEEGEQTPDDDADNATATANDDGDETGPGFGIGGTIAALGGLSALARNRLSSSSE